MIGDELFVELDLVVSRHGVIGLNWMKLALARLALQ
jgi:hypothetical protein